MHPIALIFYGVLTDVLMTLQSTLKDKGTNKSFLCIPKSISEVPGHGERINNRVLLPS
jgi:hypothetical protein